MGKEKILIIDDEKNFLDLLKSQLELQGYAVSTAMNGIEGLKKVEEESPNLIICDIKMPKKNGYEVLDEIRRVKNSWVPFIMLSALSDFDNIKQAYDGDSDFYISKPVQLDMLTKNIRTLLNLAKNREK